ncbi:hypothetical protein HMPREF9419_0257 [Prevotella nigrescens ATCC 33563]|nr:hypothetical protein HMPREF9419_0257 [Prevotella nigrescens ATCC 33563]
MQQTISNVYPPCSTVLHNSLRVQSKNFCDVTNRTTPHIYFFFHSESSLIAFVCHCCLHILRESADLSDFFSYLATKVASIDIMLNNELLSNVFTATIVQVRHLLFTIIAPIDSSRYFTYLPWVRLWCKED